MIFKMYGLSRRRRIGARQAARSRSCGSLVCLQRLFDLLTPTERPGPARRDGSVPGRMGAQATPSAARKTRQFVNIYRLQALARGAGRRFNLSFIRVYIICRSKPVPGPGRHATSFMPVPRC